MGVCPQQNEDRGRAMRRLFKYAVRKAEPEHARMSRPLTHRLGSLLGRARRLSIVIDHARARQPDDTAAGPVHAGRAAGAGGGGRNGSARRTADVVIVTALAEEHAALIVALGCEPRPGTAGRPMAVTEIDGLRIAVESLHGMGNVSAASAASSLMVAWRADYLILVGITGGFESADVRPGDIVVPDQVVGYESGKLTADGAVRRPEVYRPDFDLLTAARAVELAEWATTIRTARPEPGQAPRIRFGTVLSGEKVVADALKAAEMRESWPKAVAIEMESYGSALAMYRHGGRFLMVKGVSDLADAGKDDRWRAYAAEVAARFTRAVLGRIPTGRRTEPCADLAVPGPVMLSICWALVDDWSKLAYYFEIPRHDQVGFPPGHEPMRVWEWLVVRRRLHELPAALVFIGRQELAEEMLRAAGNAKA
jgi:adenosylhomocysteine nucleosidase